jgi:1,4-alpha-glucan branching enzyme
MNPVAATPGKPAKTPKGLLDEGIVRSIVEGTHGAPYDVFGMRELTHDGQGGVVVRTFQPYAKQVEVLNTATGEAVSLERVHDSGFFEKFLPGAARFVYRFRMTGFDNHQWEAEDPYRFPLVITDFDLHLHGEGTHFRTYEKMGAHPMVLDGVAGVHFAVWAPNAVRVSVIGWFNRWDGRHHPMQNRGASGLWELFVPALCPGDLYKFEIKGPHGFLGQKSDPYGFASELRPRTASAVWDVRKYQWNDDDWIRRRRETDWLNQPISVYEVHLGSWMRVPDDWNRWLTYRELADQLIPYVQKLGFTHIELLPISEHPFDGSWGYQTIGYYAPTSRFGNPDDFKFFVDRCHQAGLGVIIDWVPAHFPKDGHGLAYFDGTHLYEHADPRKGQHMDWGTLIFNYGRNEIRTFLLSNAVFWADVYHIDGIRVDAVASMLYLDYSRNAGEWIPNEFGGRENLEAVHFLKKFNEVIHAEYPGFLTFAEESTAWPMVSRPTYLGGLGFGLKWNMGWMHDSLVYFSKEPVHRKFHQGDLTFSLLYAFTENFILPFSHDEVVHGKRSMLDKMPGDLWQKFAGLRLLYAYMWAHPGKKLLFMGCEFGQWNEWNCHESLQWHLCQWDSHAKLQTLMTDLNALYRSIPALHEVDFSWEGFEWIDFHDADNSVLSFVRKGRNPQDVVLGVFNFTPVPRPGYRVGVPFPGEYREILNTDSDVYGGTNVGNYGGVSSEAWNCQGRDHSIPVTLPPLGAVWFRPVAG